MCSGVKFQTRYPANFLVLHQREADSKFCVSLPLALQQPFVPIDSNFEFVSGNSMDHRRIDVFLNSYGLHHNRSWNGDRIRCRIPRCRRKSESIIQSGHNPVQTIHKHKQPGETNQPHLRKLRQQRSF